MRILLKFTAVVVALLSTLDSNASLKIKRATFDPSEAALVSDAVSLSIDGTPGTSDAPKKRCCDEADKPVDWEPAESSDWTVKWSGDCAEENGGSTANLSTNAVGKKQVKATVTIPWTCPESGEKVDTKIVVNRDLKVVNVTRPSQSGVMWYLGDTDLGLPAYKQTAEHTLTPSDAPITIVVTKGASKVTIGEANGGTIAVKAANDSSLMVNDVELSLMHDGKEFTQKKFHHTVVLFEASMTDPGANLANYNGFLRVTSWLVKATFNHNWAFPAAIGINESFDSNSRVDHIPNDWTWTANSKEVSGSNPYFADEFFMFGEAPVWNPVPVNPTDANEATAVCSWIQNYKIGSQTIGTGAVINTKTLNWKRGGIHF